MANLSADKNGTIVQGFCPKKIITITSGVAWEPDENDLAFRVSRFVSYYIDSASTHSASLFGGAVTIICHDAISSYTFDTTMEIEVM